MCSCTIFFCFTWTIVSIDYNGMSEDTVMMPKHELNFDLLTDPDLMLNVKLVWLVDRTACMHKAKSDTVVCLTLSWLWYVCYDEERHLVVSRHSS